MPDAQPSCNSSKEKTITAESDSDALPRTFGRYLLLKRIARGGMGEVYLATPSGTIDGAERPCVLKVIRREHVEDSSFLARFLDEARIQSQLEHPGVVRVVEAALDAAGKPFCVFEHVEGRNLSEVRLRAQQLGVNIAWPDAVAIAITLCEGLAHVHERTDAFGQPLDIVHRDLSPQNVMVAYGGDVKLIDFGTARGQNRRCHTIAGIVFAKPGYVAPEVANNNPGGVAADIYAVGIMLWEMLSGCRFLTGEPSEHLAAVAAGTRVPGRVAHSVQAPPELDMILQRMTATAIEDRYGSAAEAAQDFAQLLKRAPSMVNGQRSVRVRVSLLMHRLYPAEPTRTRSEFQRLVADAKQTLAPAAAVALPPSPEPPELQPSPDPDILAGTRYRIVGELGTGANGCIHEAVHLDLGRRVALKILSQQATADSAGFEQLRREASMIAQLEHENIVTLYDFGKTADDRAYFAMERLRGEPLDKLLNKSGALEWRSAVNLAIQACDALHAAHEAGIVHRDIKPANLFVTRNGVLKLLDFGIAHLKFQGDEKRGDSEAFEIIGTPEYMAPEQAKGVAPTAASDVYALASVLYELLTGELPFACDSIALLIDAKCNAPLVSVRKHALGQSVRPSIDRILAQALSPKPERRYTSAAALRAALQHALEVSETVTQRRAHRLTRVVTQLSVLGLVTAGALYASPELKQRGVSAYQYVLAHSQVRASGPVLHKSAALVKAYSERLVSALRQHDHDDAAVAAQAATPPDEAPVPVEQPELNSNSDSPVPPSRNVTKGPAPALENSGPENELERVTYWLENGQASRALRAARHLGNRAP